MKDMIPSILSSYHVSVLEPNFLGSKRIKFQDRGLKIIFLDIIMSQVQ